MKTPLAFALAVTLASGAMAQVPVTFAGTNRLECRMAGADTEFNLNGGFRCRKTIHETAQPFCTDGTTYSVRTGEDKCARLPENLPPPGSLVAIPTQPIVCPPAGGSPWQIVRDVIGTHDQCQRTRVEYVAPVRLSVPSARFEPVLPVRR